MRRSVSAPTTIRSLHGPLKPDVHARALRRTAAGGWIRGLLCTSVGAQRERLHSATHPRTRGYFFHPRNPEKGIERTPGALPFARSPWSNSKPRIGSAASARSGHPTWPCLSASPPPLPPCSRHARSLLRGVRAAGRCDPFEAPPSPGILRQDANSRAPAQATRPRGGKLVDCTQSEYARGQALGCGGRRSTGAGGRRRGEWHGWVLLGGSEVQHACCWRSLPAAGGGRQIRPHRSNHFPDHAQP
mmetsp:Transcript_19137/g.36879  ORF Transcript_19137/g.36879 Transcript_19137/m.36879 type:complete len:245 (+) Transcript_19137:191-925(+)